MKILHVASEVFPLVKTGGLADITAALLPALNERGMDARLHAANGRNRADRYRSTLVFPVDHSREYRITIG